MKSDGVQIKNEIWLIGNNRYNGSQTEHNIQIFYIYLLKYIKIKVVWI